MIYNENKKISEELIFSIKSYSQLDLISRLCPHINIVNNSKCILSPLRAERNPSYSCFCASNGVWLGKDFSTGKTYDNIALYNAMFPNKSFREVVKDLELLLFNRNNDVINNNSSLIKPEIKEEKRKNGLEILEVKSLTQDSSLKQYWEDRGISTNNICLSCCKELKYQIMVLKNKILLDRYSNLPLYDKDKRELRDDGIRLGLGLQTDIDSWAIRSCKQGYFKAFKGTNGLFYSSIINTTDCVNKVSLNTGSNKIEQIRYDSLQQRLYINNKQYFDNVNLYCFNTVRPFLNSYIGKIIEERDKKIISAILTKCNIKNNNKLFVVEGLFDYLSLREINKKINNTYHLSFDIIVLNSTVNAKWAIPLMSNYKEINLLLDNDNNNVGQNTMKDIQQQILEYVIKKDNCFIPIINILNSCLGDNKDLNDYLVNNYILKEIKQKNNFKQTQFKIR